LFSSLQREPLSALSEFFDALAKVENSQVFPIFSPEEIVFQPYFIYAEIQRPFLLTDVRLEPLYSRAFEDFKLRHYENSISSIGLIAEDFLTQIYETTFREPCPKNLTLGQLFDSLHGRLAEYKKPIQTEPGNFEEIFKKINKLSKSNRVLTKDLISVSREIVKAQKQERKYLESKFTDLDARRPKLSLFPKRVAVNLNELIRNRNAASHKTRIALGEYDSLRSMYCLISTIMWWKKTLGTIDWNQSRSEIIDFLIENSNTSLP